MAQINGDVVGACYHLLERLERAPNKKGIFKCLQCRERSGGEVYYCSSCSSYVCVKCVSRRLDVERKFLGCGGHPDHALEFPKIERSHKLIAEDKRSTFTQQRSWINNPVHTIPHDLAAPTNMMETNMTLQADKKRSWINNPVHTIPHDLPALTNMMETNMTLQADKKRSWITNPAQPAHAQGLLHLGFFGIMRLFFFGIIEAIENLRQSMTEGFLDLHSKLDAMRANQLHQHQRKVPRILLCTTKDRSLKQKLVTKLVPGVKAYQLHLLCEKQGHEHIVQESQGCEMNLEVDDRWKKLFPVLQTGFGVLSYMLKAREYFGVGLVIPDPQQLLQDLNAIIVQFDETTVSCGSSGKEVASRDNKVDAIQKVESAAEQWLVDFLKDKNILTEFGLQRAVYTRRVGLYCMEGHVAWLCDTHLREGLKAGYLERFPN